MLADGSEVTWDGSAWVPGRGWAILTVAPTTFPGSAPVDLNITGVGLLTLPSFRLVLDPAIPWQNFVDCPLISGNDTAGVIHPTDPSVTPGVYTLVGIGADTETVVATCPQKVTVT